MLLSDVMTYLMKGTFTNIKGVLKGNGKFLSEVGVDTIPTANSKNLVESGGVESALDAKENEWHRLSISGAGSVSFTLGTSASPQGSVLVFTTSSYSANNMGMWILNRADSTLMNKEITQASGITISMDSSGVVTIDAAGYGTVPTYVVVKLVSGTVSFS